MARKKKKTPKKRGPKPKGREDLFVAEYLVDHCARQAALRCGYSKGSADKTGGKLVKKYQAEIQKAIDASNARLEVTVDRIRQEMAELAFMPVDGIPAYMLRAKVHCLELLAKHSGMLVERHEVQGTGDSKVIVYLPDHDRGVSGVASAAEEGAE